MRLCLLLLLLINTSAIARGQRGCTEADTIASVNDIHIIVSGREFSITNREGERVYSRKDVYPIRKLSEGLYVLGIEAPKSYIIVDTSGSHSEVYSLQNLAHFEQGEDVLLLGSTNSSTYMAFDRHGAKYYVRQDNDKNAAYNRFDKEGDRDKGGVLRSDGKAVLPFTYSTVSIGRGLIGTRKEDSVYVFDTSGRLITSATQHDIEVLQNDVILVYRYGMWAIMDTSGQVLTDYIYRDADVLNDTLITASSRLQAVVTKRGQALTPDIYEKISISSTGWMIGKFRQPYGYDLYDQNHNRILRQYLPASDYWNGRFIADRYVSVSGSPKGIEYEYYDIITREYLKELPINPSQEYEEFEDETELYTGIMDNGKVVVPAKYTNIDKEHYGGYILLEREEEFEPNSGYSTGLPEHPAFINRSYYINKWVTVKLLDSAYNVVVPEGPYRDVEHLAPELFKLRAPDGSATIVHMPSQKKIACYKAEAIEGGTGLLLHVVRDTVKDGNSYHYLTDYVITDSALNTITSGPGYAEQMKPEIDKDDTSLNFIVHTDTLCGIVNVHGDTVQPFIYSSIQRSNYYGNFKLTRGDIWQVSDRSGKLWYGGRYFSAGHVEQDSSIIYLDDNNKYGVLAKDGSEVLKPVYDTILSQSQYYYLETDGKYGVYSKLCNRIVIPTIIDQQPAFVMQDTVLAYSREEYSVYTNGKIRPATKKETLNIQKHRFISSHSLNYREATMQVQDIGLLKKGVYNKNLELIWPYPNRYQLPAPNYGWLMVDDARRNITFIDMKGEQLTPVFKRPLKSHLYKKAAIFVYDSTNILVRLTAAEAMIDTIKVDSNIAGSIKEKVPDPLIFYTNAGAGLITKSWPVEQIFYSKGVDEINKLSPQVYRVKKGGYYGLLDYLHEWIALPIYDSIVAAGQYGHTWLLYKNNKVGYCLRYTVRSGDWRNKITPPQFDTIKDIMVIMNGLIAINTDGSYDIISPSGRVLATHLDSISNYNLPYITAYRGSQQYKLHLSKDGGMAEELVTDIQPDAICDAPRYGYSICTKNSKKGVFNPLTKKWIIPLKYNSIKQHTYTSFVAYTGQHHDSNTISTIYNAGGDSIYTCKGYIESVKDRRDGYCIITVNRKQGLISPDGDLVIPMEYERIVYDDERYILYKDDNLVGLADKEGNIKLPAKYADIDHSYGFPYGYRIVFGGEYYAILNDEDKIITKFKYENIEYNFFSKTPDSKHYFFVDRKDKTGVVNETGKKIIPCNYDSVKHVFNNRFVVLKKNGKWGVLNTKGKVELPFEYDYISYFAIDRAIYNKDDDFGYLIAEEKHLQKMSLKAK